MKVPGIAALAVVMGSAASALADDSEGASPRYFGGQRTIGFGPSAGYYSGLGGMIELDAGPIGVALSGAYNPLLISGLKRSGEADPQYSRQDYELGFYSSGQINADIFVGPIWKTSRVDVDFLGGYRFNSMLGHGVGLGVRVAYDISSKLRLEFHGTPSIYPRAESHLHEHGYPRDTDPQQPWLQYFEYGTILSLIFYP